MSYGTTHIINNQNYLIELNGKYVHIAKEEENQRFTSIYEGEDYLELFFESDIPYLAKLDYEDKHYAILNQGLNVCNVIDSMADYKSYINALLDDGMEKQEILTSSSDEIFVFMSYFPTYQKSKEKFIQLTSHFIDGYIKNS